MRGPGEAELVGQGHLVGDPVTRRQRAFEDRALELLGHLEVERDGTGAVDARRRAGALVAPLVLGGGGSISCQVSMYERKYVLDKLLT